MGEGAGIENTRESGRKVYSDVTESWLRRDREKRGD